MAKWLNRQSGKWTPLDYDGLQGNWNLLEGKFDEHDKKILQAKQAAVSAYQEWLNAGNVGSVYDFFGSLKGDSANPIEVAEELKPLVTEKVQEAFNKLASEQQMDSEVINARENFPSLDDRLDHQKNNISYLLERPKLQNGKINLPLNFKKLPFEVYKDVDNYKHNAHINSFGVDFSTATEVYISDLLGGPGYGLNNDIPITVNRFKLNYENGVYGSQDKFIFNIVDNLYRKNTFHLNLPIHMLIRAYNISGVSWFGSVKVQGEDMSEFNFDIVNSLYKSTLDNSTEIIDMINFIDVDNQNVPYPYRKKQTLEECKQQTGTFYQNGTDLFVNLYPNTRIKYLTALYAKQMFLPYAQNKTIIFENINFCSYSTTFVHPTDRNGSTVYFNPIFYRGRADAFAINGGKYDLYLFNPIAAYGGNDGLNYHTTSKETFVFEFEARSYGHGKYKDITTNLATTSNNASTAHDGMNILRIGGDYRDCEGPIIADVNDCYSIVIGAKVGSALETQTTEKVGILMNGTTTTTKPKYIIGCEVYGNNLDYGISSDFGMCYVMDYIGNQKLKNVEFIKEFK